MTLSRRQLYAAGEAFGDSATRREAGRTVCGGGGSSSSSSDSQQVDKRNAVQNGVGISGDGNTLTMTDHGAVKGAMDAVSAGTGRALDSVDKSTALVGVGYEKLLTAADKLFQRGEALIGQTQQHVQDAYLSANTDAKGAIDQKTIIALAVAGVAAAGVIAYAARKG